MNQKRKVLSLFAALLVTVSMAACEPAGGSVVPDDSAMQPEARALWVARMAYKTADDVRAIIKNAADHHFNVIIWQVRGNATAYYPSSMEPWAWELTGEDPSTLGQDPGWDPLQLAIDEAHARGLELHAWVNVFPAWKQTTPPPEGSNQLWNTHRDWFMQNKEGGTMWPQDWWTYWYTFLDPGVPEVKAYLHDVFLEIVQKYPVDGIHYDYIRYPGEVGDWAYNETSIARFKEAYKDYEGASPSSHPVQWGEWKRRQITEIVHAVYRDAHNARPDLLVSAAALHDWPTAHNDYSQDARTWLSRGIVDATMPMLYLYKPADFGFAARDHLMHAYGRWVWPGLNAGRSSKEELLELIAISRELGAVGVTIFSYDSLFPEDTPNDKAQALLEGPFKHPVDVPERSW